MSATQFDSELAINIGGKEMKRKIVLGIVLAAILIGMNLNVVQAAQPEQKACVGKSVSTVSAEFTKLFGEGVSILAQHPELCRCPARWILSVDRQHMQQLKSMAKGEKMNEEKDYSFLSSIEIDNEGELCLLKTSYPAAWLRFKVFNGSGIDLHPKRIIALVIYGDTVIDKIDWWRQEKIFEKKFSRALAGGTAYHSIPEFSTGASYPELYYPLPPHVDFEKGLGLCGIIECDCDFGTVVKEFDIWFEVRGN